MLKNLIDYLANKKILVLGFGREGKSTYRLIRKYLKEQEIYIADKNEINDDSVKTDLNVVVITGESYLDNLQNYDIIIKSPGISLAYKDTSLYINKITSQLELFLQFFKNFTIGVTGTKGKSTTSSLIYTILKEQNVETILLGNIGVPVFDYLEKIQKETVIVLEMSSHQLEYMNLSPNIAVLLNIYEEHLDHYESFEKYAEAKCNIFKYQKETDYFLYNIDNEMSKKMIQNTKGNTYTVSLEGKGESNIYVKGDKVYFNKDILYDKNEPRNLMGDYNLNNIMFALAIANILKLDINKACQSVNEFKTLSHRLEFVGKYDGILFYDNSIGTIPSATIEAIKALEKVDTLIIGGMDRGLDYKEFIEYLNRSNINNIICMPKTGHDIAESLNKEKVHIVNTLEEAVATAKKITEKEKICLLSPTAASYGFFKNFEEKGDLYKKLIIN